MDKYRTMRKPAVSVILPVYNAAKYLWEAIQSIARQTFEDFEIICVDDGSTDESPAILQSFSDDRIRIFKQENRGVVGALNAGLEQARGDIIARMDADDIAFPERFKTQYDYLSAHPNIAVAGSFYQVLRADGRLGDVVEMPCSSAWVRRRLMMITPLPHPTVMYRRKVIERIGPYPDCLHVEDYLFWMSASRHFAFANLPQPLLGYRFHEGNVSRQYAEKQIENHRKIRREFWAGIPEMTASTRECEAYLRQLLKQEKAMLGGGADETKLRRRLCGDAIFLANLAFGAGRDDIGALSLIEICILDGAGEIGLTESDLRTKSFRRLWTIFRENSLERTQVAKDFGKLFEW
jgi:glycosyltransferase involved in cell wall biosynthesis